MKNFLLIGLLLISTEAFACNNIQDCSDNVKATAPLERQPTANAINAVAWAIEDLAKAVKGYDDHHRMN